MAEVARDHRRHLHAALDAQASTLDEIDLNVNHEKSVPHAFIGTTL